MTEGEIRERIRRMLRTGDIECDDTGRVWAGEGSGKRCAACLEAIVPTSVEYEADLNGRTLHFHMRCHQTCSWARPRLDHNFDFSANR